MVSQSRGAGNTDSTGGIRRVAFFSIALFLAAFLVGCGESPEAEGQKESAKAVNQAGRIILASRGQINLTDAEIDQAASLAEQGGGGQSGQARVAKRIVGRLEKKYDVASIDEALERVAELESQSVDAQAFEDLSRHLSVVVERILQQNRQADAIAEQVSRKKLKQADSLLRNAISVAGKNGVVQAKLAPELMLGTLNLLLARDSRVLLSQADIAVGAECTAIVDLVSDISKQQGRLAVVESLLPDDAINLLYEQLRGGLAVQHGHLALLQEAEALASSLENQRNSLQLQLDTLISKARQIDQRYLALVEQSSQTRGQERYDLMTEAYELRVGILSKEGGRIVEGGIYCESQCDKVQDELEKVTKQLSYQKLRVEQLRKLVAEIQQKIADLDNSPIRQEVKASRLDYASQLDSLLDKLSVQVKAFTDAEQHYSELRVEAVDAYDQAAKAFTRAASSAGRDSNTRSHAREFAELAQAELSGLWQEDASHYLAAARVMAIIEQVEHAGEVVKGLAEQFEKQAARAQASATALMPVVDDDKDDNDAAEEEDYVDDADDVVESAGDEDEADDDIEDEN